jgi:hypothetical protein
MPDFYRTRMCPSLVDLGSCPRGDNCSYAHDEQQLREGVTKGTSNAAHFAHSPKLTKGDQKPHVRPQAHNSLQQLLVCYGVPEPSGKLTGSQSPPRTQEKHETAEQEIVAIRKILGLQQDLSYKPMFFLHNGTPIWQNQSLRDETEAKAAPRSDSECFAADNNNNGFKCSPEQGSIIPLALLALLSGSFHKQGKITSDALQVIDKSY